MRISILTKKISNYSFDCYELNMSPVDRRAYLHDYEEKLHAVVYAKNLEDMTTNETKTLWRKLYGNSQYASPLVDYLGSVIDDLDANLGSIKNQKKSQLRKKTLLLNKKQEQINTIEDYLQKKDQALDELSIAYQELKEKIGKSHTDEFIDQFEDFSEKINLAKRNQDLLLESIRVLSQKITQYNIPLSLMELPHYKSGLSKGDLID
jgi:chromosome segregation ATPase